MSAAAFRDPNQIEQLIRAGVAVDAQLLLLAKSHLVEHSTGEARSQTDAFLSSLNLRQPDPIVVHPTVDTEAAITVLVRSLSAKIALGEAVWALIGAGILVPRSSGLTTPQMHVGWTTVIPGSGGTSSGWNFEDLAVPFPERFSLAPSRSAMGTHLTDGDLYLATLDEEVHPLVAEAIRDGVRSLRADLYLPALAMLAKAAEGLWTLFAAGLAAAAPTDAKAGGLGRDVEGGHLHFAQLVDRTTELYARQDLYREIALTSGASLADVRAVREWTEVVRDSRNVLHFTAATPVPITYEKAAALFLGAVPNFRVLLAATRAAVAASSEPGRS
jgi:hypothetical protein